MALHPDAGAFTPTWMRSELITEAAPDERPAAAEEEADAIDFSTNSYGTKRQDTMLAGHKLVPPEGVVVQGAGSSQVDSSTSGRGILKRSRSRVNYTDTTYPQAADKWMASPPPAEAEQSSYYTDTCCGSTSSLQTANRPSYRVYRDTRSSVQTCLGSTMGLQVSNTSAADSTTGMPPGRTRLRRTNCELSQLLCLTPSHDLQAVVNSLHPKQQFCAGASWQPQFIARLISEGFITMCEQVGCNQFVLLPKLHVERCLISRWTELHVAKNLRKRSKGLMVTVDCCFDRVWAACDTQHSESWCRWLHPPLHQALQELHVRDVHGVRAHSFELWDPEGRLVAAEIGTAVGSLYTSLTGFANREVKSSGTVQLVCTGKLLEQAGFSVWDLGMSGKNHRYKLDLGARASNRSEFVPLLREAGQGQACSSSLSQSDARSAASIIYGSASQAQ